MIVTPRMILWIEDDLAELNLGCGELRCKGFDIIGTADNDEALELLRHYGPRIGLVIQNVHRSPGYCLAGQHLGEHQLTGISFLARCVRTIRPDLPCIFITGTKWGYEATTQAKQLGNCILFEKPVLFNYLIDAARAYRGDDTVTRSTNK